MLLEARSSLLSNLAIALGTILGLFGHGRSGGAAADLAISPSVTATTVMNLIS